MKSSVDFYCWVSRCSTQPTALETVMFNLENTPYLLTVKTESQLKEQLRVLEERIALLRLNGSLTDETVRNYYGEKRFEQVAESNAIEGSTLSAGETELAVLKGVTITGHDPAFVRDAIDLDKALIKLTELAKNKGTPTDIQQVHTIHQLILGDRAGAGIFRNVRVSIRGSKHTPPKTWQEVMTQMEVWQQWSIDNANLPAPIRAAILHAWLAHIHPYVDGNGRTARAITNLELTRAGYPPIIIKKKERERYIDALGESDQGGDVSSFLELIFERVEGALTGLELSAKKMQGFNPALEKIRISQQKQLKIWETSVKLLASIIEHQLNSQLDAVKGSCNFRIFETPLDLEDYVAVCEGHSVSKSWALIVAISVPGLPSIERLAYVGHRSARIHQHLGREGGPSLYWARKNPDGFPKWISDEESSPYAVELTTRIGNGDEWHIRLKNDYIETLSTTELASKITSALISMSAG